ERDKNHREVEEIPVRVLQNKRKRRLATVRTLVLSHGTSRRIQKERSVVRFAVVVARRAEPQRPAQNQQCRGPRPPVVPGIDQRRRKWREIRTPLVESAFERPQ